MYDHSPLGGGYRYKQLPTGIEHSKDIFQQKMNGLFYGFEFIRPHIYDLLVLTKLYLQRSCTETRINLK